MLIILAHNTTGKTKGGTSDYDVQVKVNDDYTIWAGTVKGHVRANGAAPLLRKIADAMERGTQRSLPLELGGKA